MEMEYEMRRAGGRRCNTAYDIVFLAIAQVYTLRTSSNYYIYSAISIFTNPRHGTFARLPSLLLWNTLCAHLLLLNKTHVEISRKGILVLRNMSLSHLFLSFPRNYQSEPSTTPRYPEYIL